MSGEDALGAAARFLGVRQEIEGDAVLFVGELLRAHFEPECEKRVDELTLGPFDADPAVRVALDRQIRDRLVQRTGEAEGLTLDGRPVAGRIVGIGAQEDAGVPSSRNSAACGS